MGGDRRLDPLLVDVYVKRAGEKRNESERWGVKRRGERGGMRMSGLWVREGEGGDRRLDPLVVDVYGMSREEGERRRVEK